MNEQIEQKLGQANILREQEQYSESIKLFTECLLELIPSGDPRQLVHCLAGHSLIYKILIRKDDNRIYKNLNTTFSEEAYAVAEENKDNLDGNTLSTAYFGLGDALVMSGKFQDSLPLFEKSYETSTAPISEKGRIKSHIGGVKYVMGDKEKGMEIIHESLSDIRTGDMTTSNVRTWETGVLIALAKIYAKEGNLDEAKKMADESLQIATDHNLPIRKRETEDLISKFASGNLDFSI